MSDSMAQLPGQTVYKKPPPGSGETAKTVGGGPRRVRPDARAGATGLVDAAQRPTYTSVDDGAVIHPGYGAIDEIHILRERDGTAAVDRNLLELAIIRAIRNPSPVGGEERRQRPVGPCHRCRHALVPELVHQVEHTAARVDVDDARSIRCDGGLASRDLNARVEQPLQGVSPKHDALPAGFQRRHRPQPTDHGHDEQHRTENQRGVPWAL